MGAVRLHGGDDPTPHTIPHLSTAQRNLWACKMQTMDMRKRASWGESDHRKSDHSTMVNKKLWRAKIGQIMGQRGGGISQIDQEIIKSKKWGRWLEKLKAGKNARGLGQVSPALLEDELHKIKKWGMIQKKNKNTNKGGVSTKSIRKRGGPATCQFCGVGFARVDALKRHIK